MFWYWNLRVENKVKKVVVVVVVIIVLLKNQHLQIPIQLEMDDEEPLCVFPTSETLFTIYYY